MIASDRYRLRYLYFSRNYISELCTKSPSQDCSGFFNTSTSCTLSLSIPRRTNYYHFSCHFNFSTIVARSVNLLTRTQINTSAKIHSNAFRCACRSFYSSHSNNGLARSVTSRRRKKSECNSRPPLDQAQFQKAVSQLPPRFSTEELCSLLNLLEDPMVCLELFNWASQQPRFRHDVSTYHITIKKLGAAKLYQEMDDVVNQVLAVRHIGSEALYNTIIYYFTEARKFTRAVNIFKHMRSCNNLGCRPSIRTYNLLFAALLGRGCNSYVNYMYMETIRSLFKQMVNDGIEPDIFSLNSMIKGYVHSLHVNDALRIFHQMGVVYSTLPNSHSYNYLIHGLCAQGRTNNATELCNEMKTKGFVPSSKTYNSLVNALALGGEINEAVDVLWEMIAKRRSADLITYRTVLDELCRRGRVEVAMGLLKEFQEKDVVDGLTYRKLLQWLEDDSGNFNA
ncbi:pentatricopeptide repeat-containing protein At2g27800, mitochondrial [Malania oleifera]|uniref:pentatricopeptide repeat-containing protein At2g27800, mitochondrial n=1 Tax=Malania oleifera TaxID=397392 RepID=UPI0025AE2070|nr:pentatricopeptide repeat-containing protein At2g27800, mitochondrial [Malania oleifera]XP_057956614.1 pentatricopeptide repeat-containing protein At2g27800, mitochondrial [Malania oleifera]XP_057956616.1 pentatricopeptide repeat-containing protein At2g27800, mitochondrial [Malania oleifera]